MFWVDRGTRVEINHVEQIFLSKETAQQQTIRLNHWPSDQITNMPFPNCLVPVFQSEALCKAFHMEISFICIWMKTHFHMKGYAPRLALKKRYKRTRKWPIHHLLDYCSFLCGDDKPTNDSSRFDSLLHLCFFGRKWNANVFNLQQFCSSVISPQSLSPSHFHFNKTQRWLRQVSSLGLHVGVVQLLCSSELSPQSLSWSHTNRLGMHRVLLHKNLSGPQPSGFVVAVKCKETFNPVNPSTPRVSYGDMKAVLTFDSVDEFLWCDYSNEILSAVLLHGTIYI